MAELFTTHWPQSDGDLPFSTAATTTAVGVLALGYKLLLVWLQQEGTHFSG
jgi:hypothetical protein